MNIRVLDPDEYHRLHEIEDFEGVYPSPATSKVVVAEEDGVIRALWVAAATVHLEPFWVDEELRNDRKGGLMYKKMAPTMFAILQALQEKFFFMTVPFSLDNEGEPVVQSKGDDTLEYLLRLGLRPGGIAMVGTVPQLPED